jgi:hypothetical protein
MNRCGRDLVWKVEPLSQGCSNPANFLPICRESGLLDLRRNSGLFENLRDAKIPKET